jgi:asparagine synthase (glutamine-hydrolysing)
MYYTPDTIGRILMPEAAKGIAATDPFKPVFKSFEGYDGPDDGMSLWLYSDYTTASSFYFSRLMLARSFGLQVRLPFYDLDLVEYGARIPAHLKLEGIEKTKRLFRVAMEGILPNIINHRKDKLGHSVPLKNWLRGSGSLISLLRETLESESFQGRGLFRREAVAQMLEEHETRRHNHSHRLWALFVLELWLRQNLDRSGALSPGVEAIAARA